MPLLTFTMRKLVAIDHRPKPQEQEKIANISVPHSDIAELRLKCCSRNTKMSFFTPRFVLAELSFTRSGINFPVQLTSEKRSLNEYQSPLDSITICQR